ncbi:MAG TPA: hypothetical protein VGD65_26545, partial [Chryseosolibacter sp.]
MKKFLSICIGCHCCIILQKVSAQDLEQIGKKNPIELSGGLSLNQVFYSAFGNPARRDPYSFVASGNINFALYGWSIPLSFTFSNQGNSFQQPFNQYSVHPTYKSITAHAGYISSSYSPYTVNGHNMVGGAVDYEPQGKFKVSALYGRLLRAVKFDTLQNALPVYERWGYGVKALYVGERNSVQLVIFHAEDNERSLPYVPDTLNLHPQENLVLSLGGSTIILKKFQLKGEVASSAVSTNTNGGLAPREDVFGKLSPLFTSRSSTTDFNAYKANFDYQHPKFTLGVGYEHVDPGYNTFGAYYFNNDLENITVNASTSIFDGKVSMAASIGKQHDNLNGSKISTLERTVGSANVAYSASEKLSLAVSYSTFQSYTNIRSQFQQLNQLTPYENIDTLNFTQLSRSANATASYLFGKSSERKQNLNLNFSVQGASDLQGDVPQNSGMWFYNVNCSYSLNLTPQNTIVAVSINASMNDGENSSMTYGPVASVSKLFMEKKVKLNASVNYNSTTGLAARGMKV